MPHVLVVANSWQAHESQKRAWPHGTNTILALWLIQQISQKLYDDVEAEATGTAYAADEYSTFLSLDVYSLVVTCSFRYSTCPVAGYYSTFPLLDVSTERHYLQFYSTFPLPVISITRRFSAPVKLCSNYGGGAKTAGLLYLFILPDENVRTGSPFYAIFLHNLLFFLG